LSDKILLVYYTFVQYNSWYASRDQGCHVPLL